MQKNIITKEGKDTGRTIQLAPAVFGIEPNTHVLYLDVTNIQKGQRQGTAKTKERSEISASTRKRYKQKGTGRARPGDKKTNILRGGGRAHGPRPKESYACKLNKKVKQLAIRSALSLKAQKQQIQVIEDFVMPSPSCKHYLTVLKQLGIDGQKVLWIVPRAVKNLVLSARNVPKSTILTFDQLNTYHLLHFSNILFFETALPLIEQKYA